MNTGQAQRSAGSSTDIPEKGAQESYLGGFTRAMADWVEVLTGYRTPASSREQILENWVAEEGQGEAENRQQGASRIRASNNAGSHSVNLSSLSLTALLAAEAAGTPRHAQRAKQPARGGFRPVSSIFSLATTG
ncbi:MULTISPECIES: hypothetical protein [Bradyrhizobium]|uniref:hypothetical protein n=1 Tax=Bradyrhizobium TaxID=374 RepID=UPI001E3CE75A|nr:MULTISPECIES: hypothetical protein [Bradyrhizobium]